MSRRPRTLQHDTMRHEYGHGRPMGYIEARLAEENSPAIQHLEQIEERLANNRNDHRSHLALQRPIVTGNPELNNLIASEISPMRAVDTRWREQMDTASRELSEFSNNIREMFANAPIMRNEIDASEFDRNPALLNMDLREIMSQRNAYEDAIGRRIVPQAIVNNVVKEQTINGIKELKQVSLLEHLAKYIEGLANDPTYSMRECIDISFIMADINKLHTRNNIPLKEILLRIMGLLRSMESKEKPDANRVDFEL